MNTYLFSGEPGRGEIRRTLQNQWVVVAVMLVAAMGIRWIFHLYNPHMSGFAVYHGSPLSDGYSYTYKAINIANGYGIPRDQQPAIRPFYSMVLACLYTWTGFSMLAVTVLNVVIGGLTAALIYLCGRLVFDPLYGLAAALFFAIDPTQLIQTPQPLTEPLGLLFFVGSVYAAVLAFKTWRRAFFFLSGLLIGLSNLTRTLTLFTLPFYIALVLIVGWRDRRFKSGAVHALSMLIGFSCVMLPWTIRQERLYGLASISDNIGEAIYAATSPVYKKWTLLVQKDADAAGIPNTIGDHYRYFINRAVENVKANPGFYLSNVSLALWEYSNTFGIRSRKTTEYRNSFSSVVQGQNVLLVYLLVFTLVAGLLWKGPPLARHNLIFLLSAIGLILLYRSLPASVTFFPVLVGVICSLRAGSRLPVFILFGSLAAAVLGSAIFANPVLFRAILMTDWLFLFFFLAGIWFPAEIVSSKFAGKQSVSFSETVEEEKHPSPFQDGLASFSVRFLIVVLVIVLGFFAVSSARISALSISNRGKKHSTRFIPEWLSQSARLRLTIDQKRSVLSRLQQPPFSLLPEEGTQFSIYESGTGTSRAGMYIVEAGGFYYNYYVPPTESLWYPPLGPKPYARTLIRIPQFDFVIPGEVPSDFAGRPLLFVGSIVPPEVMTVEKSKRMWVRGLAIIPLDNKNRPDFARALCSPPTCDSKP
jgi:4-amino-4-deoxy-L-arabinose transferase-like glycosyltransferase